MLKVVDFGDLRGQLSVTVSDTGIGIAPSQQASIFDAYSQADSSTTRRFGGTGLGLTICKELVELMGGKISLHSSLGAGTSIDFTLPVRLASPIPKSTEYNRSIRAPVFQGGATVLVVDDHPSNRFIIAEQLRTLGFETQTEADGAAALAALERQLFALVLMDCHMPGMSGYETTRRIRELEESSEVSHLPVIAISAATDAEHLEKCIESGMDGVLKKPLRMSELSSMLQLWLGQLPSQRHTDTVVPPPLTSPQIQDVMAEDLAALRRFFAEDDKALAAHHAHRIRGAALMVNATSVALSAEALEEIARNDFTSDRERVTVLFSELERALSESGLLPPSAGL